MNIWDTLTHDHPDFIRDRSSGDVAANSYFKYTEDVQLLKQTGVSVTCLLDKSLDPMYKIPTRLYHLVHISNFYHVCCIMQICQKVRKPSIHISHFPLRYRIFHLKRNPS